MEKVEDLLLDLVKEKGIVKIIMGYKYDMEHLGSDEIYTSLDVIDSLMLDFHLGNYRKKKKRNVIKDGRLSSNHFRNRNNRR